MKKVFVALLTVAALGVIGYAAFDDATSQPMAVAGDQLGPDPDESFSRYRERAAASLDGAVEGENAFGLVTFARPLSAEEAAEALEGIKRVNTLILGQAAPIAIPEPVEGASRADVIRRKFAHLSRSLGVAPDAVSAVTAWDDAAAFRQLARDPEVAAVEVLPPDARWGNFGVRPPSPPA